MVVKLSNDYIAVAYEIKVLNKIRNQASILESSPDTSIGLPSIHAYGILMATNLHEDDINSETDLSKRQDTSVNLIGYYIMPKYKVTLQQYLEDNSD